MISPTMKLNHNSLVSPFSSRGHSKKQFEPEFSSTKGLGTIATLEQFDLGQGVSPSGGLLLTERLQSEVPLKDRLASQSPEQLKTTRQTLLKDLEQHQSVLEEAKVAQRKAQEAQRDAEDAIRRTQRELQQVEGQISAQEQAVGLVSDASRLAQGTSMAQALGRVLDLVGQNSKALENFGPLDPSKSVGPSRDPHLSIRGDGNSLTVFRYSDGTYNLSFRAPGAHQAYTDPRDYDPETSSPNLFALSVKASDPNPAASPKVFSWVTRSSGEYRDVAGPLSPATEQTISQIHKLLETGEIEVGFSGSMVGVPRKADPRTQQPRW